jgi:ribonuclease J
LIDNIINLIKKEIRKPFDIIITGGFAELIKSPIKTKVKIDKNITYQRFNKNFRNFIIMKDELLFCPLGGSGEIGMNMNLFGYGQPGDHKWVMVDIGVTFADDTIPGVDLIYPDPGFIVERKDNLLGIVLTHAHEDHIGAIAHLWPKLKCKIFATPFTAVLIREKFKEKHIDITNDLKIVELNGTVKLEPFDIEYITLTHSILEPNGLRIKTPAGVILHTGDWKVDPNPLIGENINAQRLKEIGDEGVLAMICDSTNVFSAGRSGSESDVRKNLLNVMSRLNKRIIITSFASNVARMATAFYCAEKTGRQISLVGRSMHRIYKAARQCGYLKDTIEPIDPREAKKFSREKIVYLCTGSQGEPMGAYDENFQLHSSRCFYRKRRCSHFFFKNYSWK